DPSGPAASSRSTVPSSIATSTATPVSSLVTEAHGSEASCGPYASTSASARVTPAATVRAPHSSIALSAFTAGDTRAMDRRLVHAENWEGVGRAHGEFFSGARPVTSFVVVSGLLDPSWLVEIEADALMPA